MKFNKFLFFVFLLCCSSGLLPQSRPDCTNLTGFSLPGSDLEITVAQWSDSRTLPARFAGPAITLPPHCHLEGSFDRRVGVDGVDYALRFAVNLPDNWNGRYFFQGGGGLNGTVGEPLGNQASGGRSALSRGFAVVSTDSGHQATQGGFDATFTVDQEAMLNFHFLGNARVTDMTKPIVETYYGRGINASYFVGCSTGGREGMIMAQRFPGKYDGIVSGAPAIRTNLSNLALRWINVHLNQVAVKDAEGLPVPGGTFSKAEQQIIVDGILARCDALDGANDGMVFNVKGCDFDPEQLACPAGATENCIAAEKAAGLKQAMAGPVDSRGVQVYPGFVYDAGIDDTGSIPGLIAGSGGPPVGPSVAAMMAQDVDADFIQASSTDQTLGNSTSYRLSTFAGDGGKHIYFHGVSDPWFSALDTVGYYETMAAMNGGLETVDDWSRVFLVPGMGHCGGGEATLDAFDMISAIVEWVENDAAPDAVIATGRSLPGVSRPLCPWPAYPQYNGTGDMDEAANYSCREP